MESALAEAKKVLEGEPTAAAMEEATEKLSKASHKLAEVMYQQPGAGPTWRTPPAARHPPGKHRLLGRGDRRRVRGEVAVEK